MELNEIKKALYKDNPQAQLISIQKGSAYYSCIVGISDYIMFEVPIADMGDAAFYSKMDSKLLIRYIVHNEIESQKTNQP